jgi:hypothetical protein
MYEFDQCFLHIIPFATINDTYQENLLPRRPIQEVYNNTILPVLEPYKVNETVFQWGLWEEKQDKNNI